MRPLVLGTAGHIDHGKTALVHALTGTDTDRLPDEKRRGITIDLGFASLTLPDGRRISIVDVPGHEAFVRNMLAGATGIDVVMLVIAADEGPMPQTREHLAIIELLGIARGLVALTKIDLVDTDWLELVRDDVHAMLSSTALADAPILDVSARTGAGVDALTAAIATAAADVTSAIATATADVPGQAGADLFRMPIDRVFTVRGTGTVATGTVWSGSLRRDDRVRVLPAGLDARVRGLQQHGEPCEQVEAGARAAIALAGMDRDALSRGDTLVSGDAWSAGRILTVDLAVLQDSPAPIKPRQRVRVHVGTAEVLSRVALLSGEIGPGGSAIAQLGPGASGIAQLRLEEPVVARAGDRFVVRSYSPVHTIGGGTILESAAPKRKRLSPAVREALSVLAGGRTASGEELIMAAVALAGPSGADPSLIPFVTGLTPGEAAAAVHDCDRAVLAGGKLVSADLLRETEAAILGHVTQFHRDAPMLDGMEREAVRRALHAPALFDAAVTAMLAEGRVAALGNALALPDHSAAPGADARAAIERLAAIYAGAWLEPPELSDLPADLTGRADFPVLLRYLEREGTVLRLSATRLISSGAVSEAVAVLRSQLATGEPLGVADFKKVLKLTRRHLIPLLEHFDRTGVTRRTGESRALV